jgi:hypothetical protein
MKIKQQLRHNIEVHFVDVISVEIISQRIFETHTKIQSIRNKGIDRGPQ